MIRFVFWVCWCVLETFQFLNCMPCFLMALERAFNRGLIKIYNRRLNLAYWEKGLVKEKCQSILVLDQTSVRLL